MSAASPVEIRWQRDGATKVQEAKEAFTSEVTSFKRELKATLVKIQDIRKEMLKAEGKEEEDPDTVASFKEYVDCLDQRTELLRAMINEDPQLSPLKTLQEYSHNDKHFLNFTALKDIATLMARVERIKEVSSIDSLADAKKVAFADIKIQKDAKRDIFKAGGEC